MTRLELFYDLVFVFAFLNVTALTSEEMTSGALLSGLVVLALLWWCWTGFATVGNAVRADQGLVPLAGLASTAAILVLGLSIPEAFIDEPGGLPGPLVFASCYFLVRVLQVLVFWSVVRGSSELRRRWLLLALPVWISTILILVAALLPPRIFEGAAVSGVRFGLWVVALLVEYGVGAAVWRSGWTLRSAGHWSERHALIVLVALGESVISLGTGPNLRPGLPLTWEILVATMLGVAVIAALWWAYFDTLALAVEQCLHQTQGPKRVSLARDAYTYLHLPLIAGIIMFALGLKRILAEIADPALSDWADTVDQADLYVLYGGVVLYELALNAISLRAFRTIRLSPAGAATMLLLLTPLAVQMPALIALGLLVIVSVSLVTLKVLRPAQSRREVREAALSEQIALEAEETRWRARHRRE
ncbi:low temperature requirement protein A [Micromonospora polyrhachis]